MKRMRRRRAAVNTQGGTVSNFSVRLRALVLSGPLIATQGFVAHDVIQAPYCSSRCSDQESLTVELPDVSYLPSNGTLGRTLLGAVRSTGRHSVCHHQNH